MPADREQRQRALDPARSFIVQAPAGSGKTEVLTQRFLRLLVTVGRPERVLAITFTRKATQEMRARITSRLAQAARGEKPAEEHDRQAVALARAVLERDRERSWNLVRNPGRLRITTIDGLCMQLLARDPSRGARWTGVRVLDNAAPLHREAVRRLFADIDELAAGGDSGAGAAQQALVDLLVYLGGDAQGLENLLVDMLGRRSMWQRHMPALSGHFEEILGERQSQLLDAFVATLGRERLEHALNLAGRLGFRGPPFEGGVEERLRSVVAFARLLSTTQFKPRKPGGISRRLFPDMDACQSTALGELKEIYTEWHEDPEAIEVLERVAACPPLDLPAGPDALPASLLENARKVLNLALVELDTLMEETGEADFPAITNAALTSLGTETEPAEALLAEDTRIEHILMDEFQDTSYTQFGLLRRLTAGWQAGDGRSLFLVGDPMQSIYRFREANVGFFNDVVQQGRLGQVSVEPLSLTSNFRSNRELIDWFNETFSGVFPERDEVDSGAVSYTQVHAEREPGGAVDLHVHVADSTESKAARHITWLVSDALDDPANETIAVLVRARSQVREITVALGDAGIDFEAVEMEALAGRPVVQDLRVITRALAHPMDRVAWIALLRAPWCGLAIADIHRVVGEDANVDVLQAIGEAVRDGRLDVASLERLGRVHQTLAHARARRGRHWLSSLVELSWHQLGGPMCCTDAADAENAQTFFEILEEVEQFGAQEVVERLEEALDERYAASRPARVQIMTIHNAKGLEFDVVIIPDLQRAAGRPDRTLIALQEFVGSRSEGGVLMAPYTPTHLADASIYRYLNRVEAERSRFEDQRVLYVACTRARRRLHLLASVELKKNGEPSVRSGTFLALLGDAFRPHFENLPEPSDAGDEAADGQETPALPLLRLAGPLPEPDLRPLPADEEPRTLDALPDREAVALGTALHRWLELMHDHPGQGWDAARIEAARPAIRTSLGRAGAPEERIADLERRCVDALVAVLEDEAFMSVLNGEPGQQSWSELALYSRKDNGIRRHVIDLLLQDADGALRVIDYKSGRGQGEQPAVTAKWQAQLDRYCELVERLTGTYPEGARIKTLERVLEENSGPGDAGA